MSVQREREAEKKERKKVISKIELPERISIRERGAKNESKGERENSTLEKWNTKSEWIVLCLILSLCILFHFTVWVTFHTWIVKRKWNIVFDWTFIFIIQNIVSFCSSYFHVFWFDFKTQQKIYKINWNMLNQNQAIIHEYLLLRIEFCFCLVCYCDCVLTSVWFGHAMFTIQLWQHSFCDGFFLVRIVACDSKRLCFYSKRRPARTNVMLSLCITKISLWSFHSFSALLL